MGNWCLHASSFIFDQIIRKVAGNQDRHKSSVEFDFGPDQTIHFGVTCPWVTKISHIWTWISLKPVGQSWSNFMCSIIGVGERLHKVLGQIDLGTLDSGEQSLPFGLLVYRNLFSSLFLPPLRLDGLLGASIAELPVAYSKTCVWRELQHDKTNKMTWAQQRLGSALTSAQSDESLRCLLDET